LYRYDDICSAHDALDAKLNITDVKLVAREGKDDPVKQLMAGYGYDADSVREIGKDYAQSAILAGVPTMLADGVSPEGIVPSLVMSGFFQGFMVALYMIHEYTGQKAA
jgi:hypothetical protein